MSEMLPVKKGDYRFVFGANCNLQERGGGGTKVGCSPPRVMTTVECPLQHHHIPCVKSAENNLLHDAADNSLKMTPVS